MGDALHLHTQDMVIVGDLGMTDASHISSSPFSSFTAVNQQPIQILTPHSSSDAPVLQNEGRRRAHVQAKRARNTIVAQYLGLGTNGEPLHLEKYAPVSDIPRLATPQPARKQRRKVRGEQQASQPERRAMLGVPAANQSAVTNTYRIVKARHGSHTKPVQIAINNAETLTPPSTKFDDKEKPCDRIDEHFAADDDFFHSDLNDEDFLTLTPCATDEDSCGMPVDESTPSTDKVISAEESVTNREVQQQQTSISTKSAAKSFVSPVTRTTRLFASVCTTTSEEHKPVVRPPFPDEVRDRSPIIGLTSNSILRTCFRIGEALNQAHQAARSNKIMMFELYARVLEAERNDLQQNITFCDLFHARAPYLKAVYPRSYWKLVPLFDYDSKRLMLPGRICRCIGKILREGDELFMIVLNIWEATWDDVQWVAGVVAS